MKPQGLYSKANIMVQSPQMVFATRAALSAFLLVATTSTFLAGSFRFISFLVFFQITFERKEWNASPRTIHCEGMESDTFVR